jgi:ABC-type glycerol-3-phosphate transport system substrate-binding protein
VKINKLSRREFLRLTGFATAGSLLAACAPKESEVEEEAPAQEETPAQEATPEPVQPTEKVELRVSHWWGERLDRMMENFSSSQPDVDLLPEPKPWSGYHDAILTQTAGGVAPDVYLVSMAYFPQLVRKDAFLSLDDFMTADGFDPTEEYVVDPTPAYSYDGELYSVDAWMPGSVYIACNLDLFEEAGITAPVYGTDEFDTWKFGDIREAANALTKRGEGGSTEQWGLSNPGSWQDCNNQYGWQNGGDWFDTANYQDETKCIIDSPEMIEAYQLLVDMHFEDQVTPSASQQEMLGENVFLSGKIGMVHTWMIYANFADAQFEWAVIPIPWQTHKYSKIGGGNGWSMTASTEVPKVCWSFIKFVTTEEAAYEDLVHTVMPPSKPERFLNMLEPKEAECWEVQLARSKNEYWKPANWGSRAPSQYNDLYVAWMDRVYQGEIGVEEALHGIADETNELIAELIAEEGA